MENAKTETKQAAWKRRQIENGKCVRCGKKRDGADRRMCKKCRGAHNAESRKYWNARRRAAGIPARPFREPWIYAE